MIKKVLLDLDGVLVDFIGGACATHNKAYANHPHEPEKQEDQMPWDIEPIFGLGSRDLWAPFDRQFWASLKPLPHFTPFLLTLEAFFGQENICLLTSPPLTEGSVEGKRDWIYEYMPQYRRRYLIGPAKEFCASASNVLIDDNEDNISKFKEEGGQTFLVPAPWNNRFKENSLEALKTWIASL